MMKIRITPLLDNDGPAEKLEFQKLVQSIALQGYATLLLHYTDGSVLMRKMRPDEFPPAQSATQINRQEPG